ncbi:MAG: LapA family protein [Armatimonadota bacterium]|nr:LapA family protein [Armatimonadota bacterium]MDR5696294.1 LapA family protein [Armatimonadota bacterium]
MRFQTSLALILLAAAAAFALLNPTTVVRTEVVNLPTGSYQTPLIGVILIAAAGAILLMLAASGISLSAAAADRRRLEDRLAAREHEIAEMKSRAYDTVSEQIAILRNDLTRQIDELRARIEGRPAEPTRAIRADETEQTRVFQK